MGGHGGLNILPQKRWNVYNFDNREKVKKDEEEAARKEAIEKQQARQRDAEFRLERLREAAQAKKRNPSELRITGGYGAGQPLVESGREDAIEARVEGERPQHFNLFAGIEAVGEPARGSGKAPAIANWKDSFKEGRGLDKRDIRELKKLETKVPGPEDEGYAFGYGLVGKNGKRPWYSTKGFMIDRTTHEGGGSRRARSRTPDEEQRESKRSRRKEEKSDKQKKEEKSTNGRKSIEELRAERLKREQQERDKARKLVVASKTPDANGGYGVNRSGRPYYHQGYGNAR